jgi:BNR/Asp-box repeat.
MKKHMRYSASFLICAFAVLFGCSKQGEQLDHGWTPPVKVTDSIDSLAGGVALYKCLDSIVALQSPTRCFFMDRNTRGNDSWREVPLTGFSPEYTFDPAIDQPSGRIVFDQSYVENEQLEMNALFVRMTKSGKVQIEAERKWTVDKKALFGDTGINVKLAYSTAKRHVLGGLGTGVINDTDVYLPYCINGETYHGKIVNVDDGPFNNGIFRSTDFGMTWQMERISSDFRAFDPLVSKSKTHYYYFATRIVPAHGYQLWFSRKSVEGSSWDAPKTVTKPFATAYGRYAAVSEDNTVHVCWMDCRHNMWRFNIDGPPIENDDIVYRHRKDSDKDWSKDAVLSKGLRYSYPPSMSAEGNKVVVTWAGIRSAGKVHSEYDPNDIYYVTSKDGGETWAKPLKVTDKAKEGIVSGKPQVMLLNGVIHLFYIQGALGNPEQLSPGLTRLKEAPWPIYYQQRPFPD